MKPLAKDQIQQLTPEQQETLASIGLQSFQAHQQLMARAHSYPGRTGLSSLILIGIIFLAVRDNIPGLFGRGDIHYFPSVPLVALAILITWHAAGINRRLDALMKLLDTDIKESARSVG